MKVLKYIMFLSLLSGLFFVIYRQSDEKGYRRWWMSFRIAVFIAAIGAGLIPVNTEAMEPHVNNNQSLIEKILDISGGDKSKSGPGAKAKLDARKNFNKYLRSREKRRRLLSFNGLFEESKSHIRTNIGTKGNPQNPVIDPLGANRPTKKTRLTMVKSDSLDEFGVSTNRDQFPDEIRQIEERTKRRRAQPTTQSEVDSKKYYAKEQDVIKGESHLPDFKIDPNDLSPDEIAQTVYDISEDVLKDPETESYLGTLNLIEDVVIALKRSSKTVVIYEDHPIYCEQHQHHITTYRANQRAIDNIDQTLNGVDILNEDRNPALTTIQNADGLTSRTRGPNIGESIKLKESKIAVEQQKEASRKIAEAEKAANPPMMLQLQPHERISNNQLREVEEIEARISQNSSYLLELNENQVSLLSRANNHRQGIERIKEINQQNSSSENSDSEL